MPRGDHPYLSPELNDALVAARDLAQDDRRFLSTYHAIAALCDDDDVRSLLRKLGASKGTKRRWQLTSYDRWAIALLLGTALLQLLRMTGRC